MLTNIALACALSLSPPLFACSGQPLKFLTPEVRETKPLVYRKKVILGTFPDNQAVIDALHGKKREVHSLVRRGN